MLLAIGLSLFAFGCLLFVVGWYLNTRTPVQQPLPIVGAVFGLTGIGMALYAFGGMGGG